MARKRAKKAAFERAREAAFKHVGKAAFKHARKALFKHAGKTAFKRARQAAFKHARKDDIRFSGHAVGLRSHLQQQGVRVRYQQGDVSRVRATPLLACRASRTIQSGTQK